MSKRRNEPEMSVSTLVLIVIGIVALVLVILGFSFGWQNLWNKIDVFHQNTNNTKPAVIRDCKNYTLTDRVPISNFTYLTLKTEFTLAGLEELSSDKIYQISFNREEGLDCLGRLNPQGDNLPKSIQYANSCVLASVADDGFGDVYYIIDNSTFKGKDIRVYHNSVKNLGVNPNKIEATFSIIQDQHIWTTHIEEMCT